VAKAGVFFLKNAIASKVVRVANPRSRALNTLGSILSFSDGKKVLYID